jgi:hypothetical protein
LEPEREEEILDRAVSGRLRMVKSKARLIKHIAENERKERRVMKEHRATKERPATLVARKGTGGKKSAFHVPILGTTRKTRSSRSEAVMASAVLILIRVTRLRADSVRPRTFHPLPNPLPNPLPQAGEGDITLTRRTRGADPSPLLPERWEEIPDRADNAPPKRFRLLPSLLPQAGEPAPPQPFP